MIGRGLAVLAGLLALAAPAAAADVDWAGWAKETRALIADAVSTDTVNPPGNEAVLCKRFAEMLAKDGIDAQVLESAPGRANLVARLPATGASARGEPPKPALFLAHLDVVGVTGQDWSVPPLKATEKDGYLYGRGAIDDKGMAVLGLQALRLLKKSDAPRARPIVMLLTSDEESSAKAGLAWLIAQHRDLVQGAFAINEGGRVVLEDQTVRFVEVQTAEKIYVDLTLETRGAGGHSSLPVPDNAIYRLARALARLADHELPVELNETTRGMFAGVAQAGAPEAALLKKLIAGGKPARAAAAKLAESPHYNALMRTTFVATLVSGGTRENVLPARARANVNCRVMPGTDTKAFIRQIERWIDDPSVKVSYDAEQLEGTPASPVEHPFFDAVRKVAAAHFPGAVVMPVMSPGATDSRLLRGLGIPSYGLLPFPMTRADDSRMHAADERLPLSAIQPGLHFLFDLLAEACR